MKNILSIVLLLIVISTISAQDTLKVKEGRKAQLRLSTDIGLSNRFENFENEDQSLDFFYTDLKTGGFIQLAADYGQVKKVNIGIVHNRFTVSKLLPDESFVDSLGNPLRGVLSEEYKLNTTYVRISGRKYLGKGEDLSLLSSLGVGFTSYLQKTTKVENSVQQKGQVLILAASLGVDFFVTQKFAIGGEVKLLYGNLSTLEVDDGLSTREIELDESNKINLSKIEVGIGCRYYL